MQILLIEISHLNTPNFIIGLSFERFKTPT